MANENFKKGLSGYYNHTPPETFSGERLPHYLDDAFSRKDQFGFGSSQPELDMKQVMKKAGEILDEVYSSGQINQDEFKQLYSTVQKEAMKIDPNVELAHKASEGKTGLISHLIPDSIKNRWNEYTDKQSTIDYYDVWSGKRKQAER